MHKAEGWPKDIPTSDRRLMERAMAELTAVIEKALHGQANDVLSALRGLAAEQLAQKVSDPDFVPALRAGVENLLREKLMAIGMAGAAMAQGELTGLVYELPHVAAQEWASEHAAELVRNVDENTREILRRATDKALRTPGGIEMPRYLARVKAALLDGSDYRARRIAQTEPVLAYHNGSIQSYYASGQVWGRRWVAGQAGMCRVCQALNGQVVALGQPFVAMVDGVTYVVNEGELAHPFDRCRIAPVTYREALRRGLITEAEFERGR